MLPVLFSSPRIMRNSSFPTLLFLLLTICVGFAQQETWVIESLSPQNQFLYDLQTGTATGTNGVIVKYGNSTLLADRVSVNQTSGEAEAEGHVRIQRDAQIWAGDRIAYNFKSRVMRTDQFRSGKPPVFAAGKNLSGADVSQIYSATNAFITTDDFSTPRTKINARRIVMVPGKYIEAYNCWLTVGGIPMAYWPYFRKNLEKDSNNFSFTPGYRSRFGPFLLTRYTWYLNDQFDGVLHFDYRLKRGPGVGPDINYHLGRWGEGTVKYYYTHDEKPSDNANGVNVPNNRQRVNFTYLASPYTNFSMRSQVRWQTDPLVIRDFFEGEYNANFQPSTYVEINKFWNNWSVNTVVQPRVNEFQQTVERLPEVKITGFRQQLGDSPIYYESESSIDYLRQRFAISNSIPLGMDYSATRLDTYHQLLLPKTFFGWLNVTPHVGGRFTHYSKASGPGATNSEVNRTVFDTGIKTSFKASRVWTDARNRLFDMNGLRHIVEPSVDYVYVPIHDHRPSSIPQFDSTLPSLRLLPIEFPEMNAIDSIDSENVVRFGLANTLQTKRDGEVVNLLKWEVFTDWRLHRPDTQTNLTTFSDIYSDLTFSPRKWLSFESQTRYDIDQRRFRLAYHSITLSPNTTWSWSLGHYYVHNDPVLGTGNNLITSSFYYRLDENWGFHFGHQFEARNGKMQEQFYSIYRDLRFWTAALTLRVNDNAAGADDYTIAFTFSLKAAPRYGLGSDSVRPYSLFGGG